MSFTDVFGTDTLPPSEYGYNSLTLTGNLTVDWPYNVSDTTTTLAKITEVSCQAGNILTLPDARQVSVGEDFLIRNTGAEALQVNTATGVLLSTVAAGASVYFYLSNNTTLAGTFGVVGFGVSTSNVDAASLVGYGIKAIGASLNQSHPVLPVGSNLLVDATHRASLIVFTGGAGTFSLTAAASLGDDYFTLIRNDGTGTLTLDPSSAETIDGATTMQVQPGESLMLVCTGVKWYSVGYGRSTLYQFTQLTKDVSAGGTITLTAAEASNKLLTFIGNPTGSVIVVVPAIVAVYYTYSAISTAHTITLKTASGTGTIIDQGSRIIALCDGTNVMSAQSAVSNASVSLSDGSVSLPALYFASQTNTGLYKNGADGIGITVNGIAVMTFSSANGALILANQNYTQYSTTAGAPAYAEGRVFYDNVDHTLAYYNDATGVTVNIGQEQIIRVRNNTGATLTDGQVVYINGSLGNRPTVALAKADAEATSEGTIGIVTDSILNGADGYITTSGLVHGLNTNAYVEGTLLYLSPSTAGGWTSTIPVAPQNAVRIAYVTRQHLTQGSLFVRVDNGYELSELHDVKITSIADLDGLQWNNSLQVWENVAGGFVRKTSTTGAAQLPAGTTGQRPGSPVFGQTRANSSLNITEWWNGTAWVPMGGGAVGGGVDAAFYENETLISADYTIGQGAMVSGVTISIASPAVITMTNTFVADQPVRFTTTGALPTGLDPTAVYYVIATGLSGASFQVSTSIGGAAVNTSGTQSGVHSCGKVKNAGSFGTLAIAPGKVVNVPTGATWSIA